MTNTNVHITIDRITKTYNQERAILDSQVRNLVKREYSIILRSVLKPYLTQDQASRLITITVFMDQYEQGFHSVFCMLDDETIVEFYPPFEEDKPFADDRAECDLDFILRELSSSLDPRMFLDLFGDKLLVPAYTEAFLAFDAELRAAMGLFSSCDLAVVCEPDEGGWQVYAYDENVQREITARHRFGTERELSWLHDYEDEFKRLSVVRPGRYGDPGDLPVQ